MRSRNSGWLLAASLALAATACAPATQTTTAESAAPTRGNRNLITRAEIEGSTQPNVLALIHALRPTWFAHRGQESLMLGQGVDIYVDGMRQDRGMLAQMSLPQAERIEFLSPSEATFRFGTQEGSGAILVTTRRP
jgi:hypothetical protein